MRASEFWDNVSVGKPEDCWLWTAGDNGNGYGRASMYGRVRYAHRVAYELRCGPLPAGMFCLHSCDRPSCCNPLHLRAGTPQDNFNDMIARGRWQPGSPRGEINHRAKLTEADVRAIRRSRKSGAALALRYGVTRGAINHARRGLTWKHVEAHP